VSSQYTRVSKFLSFVLRHHPEAIGLTLDANGWVDINELIEKANYHNRANPLTRALIDEVVASNDKQRFAISEDGARIRANQGHSVGIDLQLKPMEPPEVLYHGTATRFLTGILKDGLQAQQRQYVHLSKDIQTATQVGQRYGKPVVLKIKARLMHGQGFMFYLSQNGVWLTDAVPAQYIEQ
jgi:putative RNA 2'-phosphotransferase